MQKKINKNPRDLLENSRYMQRREWFVPRILAVIFGVLLFCVGFSALWRPELRIREVRFNNIREVPQDMARALVYTHLIGRRWFVVPKDSLLFAPVDAIEKVLEKEFDWVSDVRTARTMDGVLSFIVSEYEPAYVSCIEMDCYYVTAHGLRFASAPRFHNGPYILLEGGTTTARAPLLPQEDFDHFVDTLSGLPLPRENEEIVRVTFTNDGDYIAHTTTGYEVRWDGDVSPARIHARLVATYQTPAFIQTFNVNPDTLDYIDARFGKKIFYKFSQNDTIDD